MGKLHGNREKCNSYHAVDMPKWEDYMENLSVLVL